MSYHIYIGLTLVVIRALCTVISELYMLVSRLLFEVS